MVRIPEKLLHHNRSGLDLPDNFIEEGVENHHKPSNSSSVGGNIQTEVDQSAAKSKHALEESPGTTYGFLDLDNWGNVDK